MAIDPERHTRIRAALVHSSIDALVCWSSTQVLLLTGYWPVMGASVAIFAADGSVNAIVPEDEIGIASASSAATLIPYHPSTLSRLASPLDTLAPLMLSALKSLGLTGKAIGIESQQGMQPSTYAASFQFHGSLAEVLGNASPGFRLSPCERIVEPLKAQKTALELDWMKRGARIAARGFIHAESCIEAGMRESEIAAAAQHAFDASTEAGEVQRSYGFFYCMSGPNSAEASGAYARTRQRRLEEGDLVLVHANTCADGYWTDITRTYTVGAASQRQTGMRSAIEEARQAAFKKVAPGIPASEIDHAARSVMERHGFGKAFRHPTGHGVGFAAANPNGLPRIHPQSPDVLDVGMTFNIEPAAYFDGYGGMRHCDVVAVRRDGVTLLTDF